MGHKITIVDTNGKQTTLKSSILGSASVKSQDGVVCVETKSVTGSKESHCILTSNKND